MLPAIVAAIPAPVIAGVLATLGVLIVLAPFVLPLWIKHLKEADRVRLHAAAKGAFNILSGIAPVTPTTIDDELTKLIGIVEKELGKSLKAKEKTLVKNIALSMQGDPAKPTLKDADGTALRVSRKALDEALGR